MVISCRFDSTLCAVLNRWNLRVASTLQHRRRSYSILQSINQKFVVGRIIGKRRLAIFGRCREGGCFELMMSTWINSGEVPGFVQIEIDDEILSFWFDALCCAELVKPESDLSWEKWGGDDVLNINWWCCRWRCVCEDFIKKKMISVYFLCKQHINYMYRRIWYLTNLFFLIFPNLSDYRSISIYKIFRRN